MEPWLEIATKFGIPVAGLTAAAWFLGKHVWPWMVEQVEKTQAAREKDLDRFAKQIELIGEKQAIALRDVSQAITAVSTELRELRK